METSVPSAIGRINNIGLLRAQQDGLLIGIGLFMAGTIFIALSPMHDPLGRDSNNSSTQAPTKSCTFCAETILAGAIVCRFCQREVPESENDQAEVSTMPASKTEKDETRGPPSSHLKLMEKYGITGKNGKFLYRGQKYNKLSDVPLKSGPADGSYGTVLYLP
jgi:hypothetical protein